ncbi:uncharacterized protein LY89DRAFT_707217 [Mollisia scopiformis]|uniref:Hemerythrin-like domain-containing protein n=1 Tax=Mollisia scopiformis TaxID=149040 RepID=A0A194X991_MOLSC|nr:uncharacterized protein LY89DRAFT_707217 [Mollisia scopiformis]KUJ16689.1 hypothetical protein LY89DRAFT_707217 [Mollisia scopiformis]
MTTAIPSPKPWADTPLAPIRTPVFLTKKHDLWTEGASHMCMMHNSLFRGYNTIYHQACHISDADKSDFIGYCLTWHKFLKAHADNEDKSLFPRIEEQLEDKTIFVESHKEHDAFMPQVENFHTYLASLPTPSSFSGPALLEIMSTFQSPFEAHMRAEVQLIASLASHPKTPAPGSKLEKTILETNNTKEGNAFVASGFTDVVPFFMFNFEGDYEDGLWKDWPPIPGPVRWGMMGIANMLHSGWWKFAACDAKKRRRELYALAG